MNEESTKDYLITVEDFKSFFKKDFDYADNEESSSSSDEIDTSLIYDSDIEKAMEEADAVFNESIFPDKKTAVLSFKYLTAYYLVLDQNNANSGGNGGGVGLLTSRHVRNVGESFAVPQWVLDNPLYSLYAQNGYGLKYLSLIMSRLVGVVSVVPGRTLP